MRFGKWIFFDTRSASRDRRGHLGVGIVALWGLAGLGGCVSSDGLTIEDRLIAESEAVSKKIEGTVERFDLYAANRKYVDEPNRSRVAIHNNFSLREGGVRTYAPHLGVHLHLPNLQKKLQLRFSTYDQDLESRGINKSRYRPLPKEPVYTGGLALFQGLGKIKTEFRPLVEFEKKATTSYLFRFWTTLEHGAFSIEPEGQLFARSDTGTGQYVGLNFGYQLNASNGLTLLNEEQYTDGDNTLLTNHGIKWGHQYNDLMSFQNSLIFETNNRSAYHLETYVYRLTFEHMLRENLLHYSFTPYLTYEKSELFQPRAAIDFKVQIIF